MATTAATAATEGILAGFPDSFFFSHRPVGRLGGTRSRSALFVTADRWTEGEWK